MERNLARAVEALKQRGDVHHTSMFLDSHLLSQLSTLILPQQCSTKQSLQQEWFHFLAQKRLFLSKALLLHAQSPEESNEACAASASNLCADLLKVLQCARLEHEININILDVLLARKENCLECVDYCCSLLAANNVHQQVFCRAVETIFVLGMEISPFQALRAVPWLLIHQEVECDDLRSRLSAMELVKRASPPPSSNKPLSYEACLDESLESLVAHFPLESPFASTCSITSRVGNKMQMNIIGESVSIEFSPSSFLAMGFEEDLNPTQACFSLEVWVSLSASCEQGGTIISSFMNEDSFPRGYTLECRRRNATQDIFWTFRFGSYFASGSTPPAAAAAEEEDEEEVYKKLPANSKLYHIVGVCSHDALSLYIDGALAERVPLRNRPAANVDAPLFCGGGFQGQFIGTLRDFSFYSSALDADTVARHYEAKTTSYSSDDDEEEDAELEDFGGKHETAYRMIRLVDDQHAGKGLVECDAALEQCFVDLLLTLLDAQADDNAAAQRAMERVLHLLHFVRYLPSRLEHLLIDLVLRSDGGGYEAAAIALALSFSRSNGGGKENVAIALSQSSYKYSPVVLQALLDYTQRPASVTEYGLVQVLETCVDVKNVWKYEQEHRRVVHSGLCLMLTRMWTLPAACAAKLLAATICSENGEPASNTQVGSDFDLEACIIELICLAAFRPSTTTEGTSSDVELFMQVASSKTYDPTLFERVRTTLPMPAIHTIRIRNKPFEQQVLHAIGSAFTALTLHLFYNSSPGRRPGMALRAFRYSWTLLGFLLNNKHGWTVDHACEQIALACNALSCSSLATPSTEEINLLLMATEQEEDEAEEDMKQMIFNSIVALAERGAEFIVGAQTRMRTAHTRMAQQTESIELLAETVQARAVSQDSLQWISQRFLLFDPDKYLHSGGTQAANAVEQLVHACFHNTTATTTVAIEICEKYLAYAPKEAFALCLSRLEQDTQEPQAQLRFRFSNDALRGSATEMESIALPMPHFISNSVVIEEEDEEGKQILALPADALESTLLLCSHSLYSGKLYFEVTPRSDVKEKEETLMRIGVESQGNQVCEYTVALKGGVGILIDLDASGGVLSVLDTEQQQQQVLLYKTRFSCPIPPTTLRPITPTLCLLTPGATVKVHFTHNAKLITSQPGEEEEEEEDEDGEAKGDLAQGVFAGPLARVFAQPSKVFACGQNEFGELGLESQDDVKPRKRLTETGKQVASLFPCSIVAGNEFSAVLSTQGQVYTWGMNTKASCAVDPAVSHRIAMPTLVRGGNLSATTFITRICCQNGSENIFAISNAGEAFAWGFNRFGNLGLGVLDECISKPTRVGDGLGALSDVANGYSHTLLLTRIGQVYSCGLNSHGQLGVGAQGDIRPFCNPVSVQTGPMVSIAVGLLHSACLDSMGEAWMFGRNDFGQLGLTNNHDVVLVPTKLALLPQTAATSQVVRVSCGYQFTLIATSVGKLYGFGKNDAGQLGLGHTRLVTEPQLVLQAGDGGRISALSCGSGHWICATSNGQLFTCGRNKAGATGDGTAANRLVPIDLEFSQSNGMVCQVAAGFHHTLVLAAPSLQEYRFDFSPSLLPHERFVLACCRSNSDGGPVHLAREWLHEKVVTANQVDKILPYLLAHQSTEEAWLETCLILVFDKRVDEDTMVLALEWLKRLLLAIGKPVDSAVVHHLLVLCSRRTSRKHQVIASQAVYVARMLVQQGLISFATIEQQLKTGEEDVTMGIVAVLGGELEVVRREGRVRVLTGAAPTAIGGGDLERGGGHCGRVVWYTPQDSPVVAKLALDDGECMYVLRERDLIPLCKAPVPDKCPESLFERIVDIAKQRNGSSALALSACKAMCSLLEANPSFVINFVGNGHLLFLSSLLGSNALERSTAPISALESAYASALTEASPPVAEPRAAAVPRRSPQPVPVEEKDDLVMKIDLTALDFTSKQRVDAISLQVDHEFAPPSPAEGEEEQVVDVFFFSNGSLRVPTIDSTCWTVLIDTVLIADPTSTAARTFFSCWSLEPMGHLTFAAGNNIARTKLPLPMDRFIRLVFLQSEHASEVFVDGVCVASAGVNSGGLLEFGAVPMAVTCLQVQRLALSHEEIQVLGKATAQGIPAPTLLNKAHGLEDQVQLPLAWCMRALELCNGNRLHAKQVLQDSRAALLRRARANIEHLSSNLGFDSATCMLAVANTTSLADAVGVLVDLDDKDLNSDPFALKRISTLSYQLQAPEKRLASSKEDFSQSVALGSKLLFERRDVIRASKSNASMEVTANETFGLTNTCKPPASTAVTSKPASFPSTNDNNTLDQLETKLFVSYVRRAIVLVLDLDTCNALLSKQLFVRDYMRAFRFSSSPDGAEEQQNPANVLRRKIVSMVTREAEECKLRVQAKKDRINESMPSTLQRREYKRARQECENAAWQRSTCKSLLQILLGELGMINYDPLVVLDSGLQVAPAHAFRLIATVSEDLRFYRPQSAAPGFYSLGDVVDCNTTPTTLMVRDNDEGDGLLCEPARFELALQVGDIVCIWRPVPPPGFAALGMVVVAGKAQQPALDCVRCIRTICLSPSTLRAGVLEQDDGQLWTVDNQVNTFLLVKEAAAVPFDFPPPQQHRDGSGEYDLEPIVEAAAMAQQRGDGAAERSFHQEIESKLQHDIVPLSLTMSTTFTSNNTEATFWVLFLLVELCSGRKSAGEIWRRRVFGAPLMRALFHLKANGSKTDGIRALRGLAAISTPTLVRQFKREFDALRREVDAQLASERAISVDPEFPLYSSELCATVELLVEVDDDDDDEHENSMRELSQVMDSLLMPNSNDFPSEFLMAEDTFLKLARPEDTRVVAASAAQQQHQLYGKCVVPNAQSLILRFDTRSCTRFGDGLALQLAQDEEECLQGNFGGCTIQAQGNSVAYRFPVHQQMNWCLSNNVRGRDIKLSASDAGVQLTATMRKDKCWQTCTATRGFTRGINSWEVRVDRCTQAANIFFGITKRPFADSYIGCNDYSWGFIGCSALWTNGRKVKPYGDRIKTGDVIRITLDFYRRNLSFAINGVDQGPTFDRLPHFEDVLYPAFSFYNKHDSITLLRGSTAL